MRIRLCIHREQIDIFINTSWKSFKLLISYHRMRSFAFELVPFFSVCLFTLGMYTIFFLVFSFSECMCHLKSAFFLLWAAGRAHFIQREKNNFTRNGQTTEEIFWKRSKQVHFISFTSCLLWWRHFYFSWHINCGEEQVCYVVQQCDTSFLNTRTIAFKIKSLPRERESASNIWNVR